MNIFKYMPYTRIRMINEPSFIFYIFRIPNMILYLIVSLLLKKKYWYGNVLKVVNAIRIEVSNYDDVKNNRHSLKCYYRYDNNNVYVKLRFYKKIDDSEYELFRNSIDIHLDSPISEIKAKDGYYYFVIYTHLEPLRTYSINRQCMSVGTYYNGLLEWDYSAYPHMLVIGESGQGKTVYMTYLLNSLLSSRFKTWCIDGKKVDYALIKDNFTHYVSNGVDKSEMISILSLYVFEMQERYVQLEQRGMKSYLEDCELQPCFLIIDEYLAILRTSNKQSKETIEKLITEIVLLGRASGFFLIVTVQRADSKYLDGSIRDNFACRVVVGRASKESYSMVFNKRVKGFERGKAWIQINSEMNMIAIPYYKDVEL